MRRLLSFGTYQFKDQASNFTDNFRDTITRTVRLPYADGGFDQIGRALAPLAIGKVQVGYWLLAHNAADMLVQKDGLKALTSQPIKQLFVAQDADSQVPRFTWARISHMNVNEDAEDRGDLWQFANIFFHCPDPHWYSGENEGAQWGSGAAKWGSAVDYWGGNVVAQSYSGPSQDLTDIVNVGNARTTARIRIITTAGQSIVNPVLTITDPNLDVYVLTYSGTISGGQTLDINGRAASVILTEADGTASDAYSDLTLSDLAFMVIPPGTSEVNLASDNAADAASIRVTWFDAYT